MTDDTTATQQILENTLTLAEAGKDEHATKFLKDQFARLPQHMQDTIIVESLLNAVEKESLHLQALRTMQEEGLEIASLLEDAAQQSQSEGHTE